jgi:hypothetical protein
VLVRQHRLAHGEVHLEMQVLVLFQVELLVAFQVQKLMEQLRFLACFLQKKRLMFLM